jgi:hypothetical protein
MLIANLIFAGMYESLFSDVKVRVGILTLATFAALC